MEVKEIQYSMVEKGYCMKNKVDYLYLLFWIGQGLIFLSSIAQSIYNKAYNLFTIAMYIGLLLFIASLVIKSFILIFSPFQKKHSQ